MTQGRRVNSFGREYQDLQTRRLDDVPTKGKSPYRNRRRFCGGKEGVEHVWELGTVYHKPWIPHPFHVEVCATCGKKRYRRGIELAISNNPT